MIRGTDKTSFGIVIEAERTVGGALVDGPEGTISFRVGPTELLRLEADGKISVRGKEVETDKSVVDGFREWLSTANASKPEPIETPSAHDEWVEIGKRCSAGRRSMWVRLVFVPSVPSLPIGPENVEAIELKAGREGDDASMRITHDNSQFAELLYLFLTAHFAATT